MSTGKETPRQKMIGMMYLVLMAMLALNVAREVLDAFVLVDESLTKTIENFVQKNDVYYQEFDQAAAEQPVKAGPWKAKADEVKRRSDQLYHYLQELKFELIREAEGEDTDAIEGEHIHHKEIGAQDNMDIPAEIMIGPNLDGEGYQLRAAIEEYRNYLLSLVSEESETVRQSIMASLDTSDPPPEEEGELPHTWQQEHFEHLPLIAVLTLMSKMQSDVRNAESDAIRYLYSRIEAGSFKFNKLDPVVIPNSNHIIRGNEYTAKIFMAAFDTTQKPLVYIGEYDSTELEDGSFDYKMIGELGKDYDTVPIMGGRGIYSVQSSGSPGLRKWGGIISLKNLDGSFTNKPFHASYEVAEPSFVVSPTKMNVFYYPVENPVEISVPGYPSDKIVATVNNGTIRGSGGNYVVSPIREGEAQINVSVRIDGTARSMGVKKFRVRPVPDPYPTIAGKRSGSIRKSEVLGEAGPKAEMPDWFEFDLEFTVVDFTLAGTVGDNYVERRANGKYFTTEMRDIVNNMRSGSALFIKEVKAVGPAGKQRDIGTIAVKLQ